MRIINLTTRPATNHQIRSGLLDITRLEYDSLRSALYCGRDFTEPDLLRKATQVQDIALRNSYMTDFQGVAGVTAFALIETTEPLLPYLLDVLTDAGLTPVKNVLVDRVWSKFDLIIPGNPTCKTASNE